MKGTLTKLDNQWVVRYDTFQNDHSYPLPAYNFLPLHPDYVKYYFLDEDAEGGEVEFDWCVIVDHDTGKGKEYAKLKRPKEQTNGERFEEFMNLVQYPELEGTMNLCNDIIEKRTGKMTEEEWQAAERAQTSSHESWEGCDGCTEQDEIMYKNGYVKGYNAAIGELPKEISDEEIEKEVHQNINYGGGSEGWIKDAFKKGAKWYREQLKIK